MPSSSFSLPSSFASQHPVLLFPVRVQVKFVRDGYNPFELRVRIYPDQLGLSTHEPELTPAEVAAGQDYWDKAPQVQPGQTHALEYWHPLVAMYGVPRARWILQQTAPGVTPTKHDASWTRAAHSLVMPTQFSVALYNTITDAAKLPDHVQQQLLAGGSRPYNPDSILNPTSEFLEQVRLETGKDISEYPLPVGFDPQSTETEGVTGIDEANRWTVDFEQALDKGMAIVVPLTKDEFEKGFKRLVVLGVRKDGPDQGQKLLEQVLVDHTYTDGFALVAQGTPTNNTDNAATGYSSLDTYDAEGSFALLNQKDMYEPAADQEPLPDGQRLTEALGVDASSLGPVPHAGATDISDAQRLNRVLWPATYGYFLEEMLRPLLSPTTMQRVRAFFETYVLARGPVPAFRVGNEPYGVLPTTRFSTWSSLDTLGQQLATLLRLLDVTWTERLNPQAGLYPSTITVGQTAAAFPKPPTAQADLLTTLAADATSVEYFQRYLLGPVFTDSLSHFATTQGQNPIWTDQRRQASRFGTAQDPDNPLYSEFQKLLDPTNSLGLPKEWPKIFDQTFQTTFTKLTETFADEPAERRELGHLIDEHPLSEVDPVAPFSGAKGDYRRWNYINWLAESDFDDIRLEQFELIVGDGSAFNAPNSLLYRLLRQAVLLQYWEAAKEYLTISDKDAEEKELFNIVGKDTARWQYLYSPGPSGQPLHQHLKTKDKMQKCIADLRVLATYPTAHLERLLAEHLDLGSYRIDAWKTALVTQRLHELRQQPDTQKGSYLGAFAWLEDLQPTDRSELEVSGNRFDPDNLGYIHAPSINHGTAAAILRQGYKSRQMTAEDEDPAANRMAVNLSSKRVRKALAVLEGLRLGHSLGVVLGQEFERSLMQHDATVGGKPYGYYVSVFREAFPIAGEMMPNSQTATTATNSDQAKQQVLDGVALLRATPQGYPYGLIELPTDATFSAFVTEQLASLTDTLDALGDLSVSEGVYQAAQGNMERATAILESVAKGQFPVTPEIVHPPHRGNMLTHRVLVHLPADTTLGNWPDEDTPRAKAEPRLNAWLAQFLPRPKDVSIGYGYQVPGDNEWHNVKSLTLDNAGLHPIDLLYLLDANALQANSAFDLLLRRAMSVVPASGPLQITPPAGAVLTVNYASAGIEVLRSKLPLLERLRQLLAASRPVLPNDLKVPSLLTAADINRPNAEVAGTLLRGRLNVGLATLKAISTVLPAPKATGAARRLNGSTSDSVFVDPTRALTAAETTAVYQALLFGLPEAAATLAADTAASAAVLRQAVDARIAAAEATLDAVDEAAAIEAEAGAESSGPDVDRYVEVAKTLFGSDFRMGVEFSLPQGAAEAGRLYADATSPAVAESLLRHSANPLPMQEWLQGMACVREPLDHLDKVLLMQDVLAADAEPLPQLYPTQLVPPASAGRVPDNRSVAPYWLGQEWPAGYTPPTNAVSLVQWLPEDYDPAGAQYGLWLDEWSETLPEAEETTALTFHYDQPNTEAAQTLLLVVAPDATAPAWKGEDLLGAVNETLDLAKKRTVEPDALAFTHLSSLLPAVVAPVAQQAVTFTLDYGRILPESQAASRRFLEHPLR